MSSEPKLGPLLRLRGLQRSQLPPATASAADLTPFITSLLSEAVPFIDSVPSTSQSQPSSSASPWKPLSTKSFPTSAAPVRLLSRHIPSSSLGPAAAAAKPETWACRVSVHDDSPTRGTASFAEFRRAIKDEHCQTEEAFTPTVIAARQAVVWGSAASSVPPVTVGRDDQGKTTTWGRFTLGLVEMRHAVGRPVLKDRVFPVLQLTASAVDHDHDGNEDGNNVSGKEKDEFVVVSVTVDDFARAEEAELSKMADVVVARYVSVERVRKTTPVTTAEGGGGIEWIMATASDARGNLPAWVQKGAVPGQIAKDVGLFLGWIAEERVKGR